MLKTFAPFIQMPFLCIKATLKYFLKYVKVLQLFERELIFLQIFLATMFHNICICNILFRFFYKNFGNVKLYNKKDIIQTLCKLIF